NLDGLFRSRPEATRNADADQHRRSKDHPDQTQHSPEALRSASIRYDVPYIRTYQSEAVPHRVTLQAVWQLPFYQRLSAPKTDRTRSAYLAHASQPGPA